nr:hypothetical protein [Pseudonocardia sp.]
MGAEQQCAGERLGDVGDREADAGRRAQPVDRVEHHLGEQHRRGHDRPQPPVEHHERGQGEPGGREEGAAEAECAEPAERGLGPRRVGEGDDDEHHRGGRVDRR